MYSITQYCCEVCTYIFGHIWVHCLNYFCSLYSVSGIEWWESVSIGYRISGLSLRLQFVFLSRRLGYFWKTATRSSEIFVQTRAKYASACSPGSICPGQCCPHLHHKWPYHEEQSSSCSSYTCSHRRLTDVWFVNNVNAYCSILLMITKIHFILEYLFILHAVLYIIISCKYCYQH